MLDFSELSPDGNDLELLTRELLFSLGFSPRWSGKGPDAGKDLLFEETGQSVLGAKSRLWLTSCKQKQTATNAVGVSDVTGIVDRCTQHGADGFLLVCSTYPSAGVVEQLEGLEGKQQFPRHLTYWDGVQLERFLLTPHNWAIAQRFSPISAEATNWRAWATDSPNRFIVSLRGFYFHLAHRVASWENWHLGSIDNRLNDFERLSLPEGQQIRPRAIWYDDKHGFYKWYIDFLVPQGEEPAIAPEDLADRLGGQHTAYEDGQIYEWDVILRTYLPWSDNHDPDHYRFYDPYLPLFQWGGERPGNQARD